MKFVVQQLRRKEKGLWQRYTALEEKIQLQVSPFVSLPDYTDHGFHHSKSIQACFDKIIPQTLSEPLTSFEMFALLAAALLHDVGMFMRLSESELAESVRLDHYNRSMQFVIKEADALNFTEHEATIIGEICRAHGMPDLQYLEGKVFSVHGHGIVRVTLLSALLRLADILDITSARAPALVRRNRQLSVTSQHHWALHRYISDVHITCLPSWDINIIAMPQDASSEAQLLSLKQYIQNELDVLRLVLRQYKIFFQKVELSITKPSTSDPSRQLKNPFLLRLMAFDEKHEYLFAGRDKEINNILELILTRNVVVVIGESGVGKTSLVNAGITPRLKDLSYEIVRFAFLEDASSALIAALCPSQSIRPPVDPLSAVKLYFERNKQSQCKGVLILGDHLEQMFTVGLTESAKKRIIEDISQILSSKLPVTFLFCIREDYLPNLYELAAFIPELYSRKNTFRLHKLTAENGENAIKRASSNARNPLPASLMRLIASELADEGGGTIYPPFLQIVGFSLYTELNRDDAGQAFELVYKKLGGVENIVNDYLDGLLDTYAQADKPVVLQILSTMVTEHHTKKRVSLDSLTKLLPEYNNIEKLLRSLVSQRIVKRSLGEYELMHDFLARRVIKLLQERNYLSQPVRMAVEYIEANFRDVELPARKIAKAAGVTPTYLASIFRKQLGQSLNQRFHMLKIAFAKKLIQTDLTPMNDIARNAGYRSSSIFSRKFRLVTGTSPMEFRNSILRTADANYY